MDLWQLRVFCKVIEHKSFSKAGEAVHLSQPTVSSHIKDLETYFGTRLVDRLPRQVVPTKAGELLYGYANQLNSLREQTEAAMAEFLGQIKGNLIIGGSTIPGGYLLPRWIGGFSRTYPDVRITMVVGDSAQIIDSVIGGRIEIGVVGARSEERHLSQVPLMTDDLCLVVPSGHRWAEQKQISLKELIKEPFIVRENGSGTLSSLQLLLNRKGYELNDFTIVAELGSTEAVRQGIKNGLGISVLSAVAVADDVQSGQLKTLRVEELDFKRHFYLTTSNQRSLSPLSRAFIDYLKSELNIAD